jgi:hypothetical protein
VKKRENEHVFIGRNQAWNGMTMDVIKKLIRTMIRIEGVGNGAFQLCSHLLHLAFFADNRGKYNLCTTHVELTDFGTCIENEEH